MLSLLCLSERSVALQFWDGESNVRPLSGQLSGQNTATQLPAAVGASVVGVMRPRAPVQGIPQVVACEAWCESFCWVKGSSKIGESIPVVHVMVSGRMCTGARM